MLCECVKGLQLECLVREFLVFGSKSRQVFVDRGRRPWCRSLLRDEEGVGMGGEAGSESGAQSKELDDHGDLTRKEQKKGKRVRVLPGAHSRGVGWLWKHHLRINLQDQAREERKRCQL